MSRARTLVLVATALAVLGLAPALAQPSPSRTLVIAVEGSAPTFDPLLAGSDSRVNTPAINLYNTLYQVVPGTTEVVPELATGYAVGATGCRTPSPCATT
jgi:ABC-type transport system substrate-binding protein